MSATDSSKREGKPPRKKRGLMQTPAVLFSVCRLSGGGLSAGGDKLEAEHQQLRLIKHISVLPAGSWVGCLSALFCIDTSISADLHKSAWWKRWRHGLDKHLYARSRTSQLHSGCFETVFEMRTLLRTGISCVNKPSCRQALGPVGKQDNWKDKVPTWSWKSWVYEEYTASSRRCCGLKHVWAGNNKKRGGPQCLGKHLRSLCS